MISAIVLAAGLSGRMAGHNKMLLPYGGTCILAETIHRLLAAAAMEIIVVTGHEAVAVEKAIQELPVKIIYNPRYKQGMTTSIQAGVAAATGAGYMICLGDMYTITAAEYTFLSERFVQCLGDNPYGICVPVYNNKKGNPVSFAATYKNALLQHKEMTGCKAILQSNTAHICTVEMQTSHILEDLDYYDDYLKLLSQQAS